MFSIALRSFCGLTVVDKAIINEHSNAKGSPVRRRKLRKVVSVQTFLESENLWMNETSQVIEKVIKDCRGIISLVRTGKPAGEVGGNDTTVHYTEIGKLLENQEQSLAYLQLYIQGCGAMESKITEEWQRST